MLTRRQAIELLLSRVGDDLVVTANGFVSREALDVCDRADTFAMVGSMGLASSIALGLTLGEPQRRVIVIDGDGNVLMGLSALPMIVERCPANLVHVVLDNHAYASTGGQRSISDVVDLARIAEAAGYPSVRRCGAADDVGPALDEILGARGPAFLLIEVAQAPSSAPRVPHDPEVIAGRFRAALRAGRAAR